MSRSVTSTGLNGAYLLQIKTNQPAKSKPPQRCLSPLWWFWAGGIEKVPAERVLDGDFAV